jgi:hypothetical protein
MLKAVVAILLLALSVLYMPTKTDANHSPVALIAWICNAAMFNPHSFSPTPVYPAEWMCWIEKATDKLPDTYGAEFWALSAYNLGI